jgi:hypothetical protein
MTAHDDRGGSPVTLSPVVSMHPRGGILAGVYLPPEGRCASVKTTMSALAPLWRTSINSRYAGSLYHALVCSAEGNSRMNMAVGSGYLPSSRSLAHPGPTMTFPPCCCARLAPEVRTVWLMSREQLQTGPAALSVGLSDTTVVWGFGHTSKRPRGAWVIDIPLHEAYKVFAMMCDG